MVEDASCWRSVRAMIRELIPRTHQSDCLSNRVHLSGTCPPPDSKKLAKVLLGILDRLIAATFGGCDQSFLLA
jgi:hypothetical protein